jgi:large subunit ribosomal protein L29
MKANELRGSSVEELQQQLEDLLKEQFNLRIQKGTGQLQNPSRVREGRREIARIKTVMSEMKADSGK